MLHCSIVLTQNHNHMVSFIISSNHLSIQQEEVSKLLSEFRIQTIDVTQIKREEDEKTDKMKQSLGIGDIKRIQKKVFLKPMQSKYKAVIINEAELLTTEAQNALLKMLEEPPSHTIIVLLTANLESLLPTIHSRCKIILPQVAAENMSVENSEVQRKQLQQVLEGGVGESLNHAEVLAKKKDEAIIWIEKSILILREEMLKQSETQTNYPALIRKLQQTHTNLKKTNANPRLQLETLFLSLQSPD